MAPEISGDLRRLVAARAAGRCEYYRLPESASAYRHEPDHIVPLQHGGSTTQDNLALACLRCNRRKGPNVGSFDPETGLLVPFFNPRKQIWAEHFTLDGAVIRPLSGPGRVTEKILAINEPERVEERAQLAAAGMYP